MEDQLAKHLPHQAPAPIREAEVIPVDHHNTEATHVAASQPSHAPEVAPPHTAFQSNETLLKEFMHVTHLDGQQAPAPISEAKVVEVHHDAPTTVAQETHAPIREAAVSEVRHTTPVADAQHVEAVAADVRAHTAEQVAQPIHSPDVKVSALAEGHVPEQVAQPIHQADVKVTALEGDKQATHSTAEAARVPAHGESSRTTEAALADAHSVLQGVHAVDSGRVGALAGDALHAARDEVKVGEAIASPHVEVAQLNSPSHIVHGHQPHGGAHSPAHAETTVAAAQPHHDARAHDSQTTNASTAAHQTDHLAGMHAPAASAMAAAAAEAREVAQSQARTSKTETVASSGPHFKGVGNLDKEAHDVLGAEHLTAMRESGRGEARSAQEFAGAVKPAAPMSFADDHKSRSDVHEALVEHWASKGVPVQEARTAVAALAPKLDEHLGQPGHPDAKLTYHAKGDVQVAIDHPHHHAAHPPTAAVAMNTLHEVHKHGMPHEGLAVAQANLGKEVDGVSRLELLDKFGPKVVNALAQEGFPHAEVAETKFHLEANMRDAGARTPEASKADALQALGVVATDSSSHINVTDKATGQSYQFTADKLRQDLGWAQEHEHQAPQAPAQQYARAETPGRDLYYGH
jgi:hypothetical protein